MSLEALNKGYKEIGVASSTSWVITHNLNTETPIVDVYIGGVKVQPLEVEATDANTVTITFTVAQTGDVYVL